MRRSADVKVIGGKLQEDSYHNGGEWLDAVHDTGRGTVTGFIHAEVDIKST